MKENEIEYLHKEISCLRNELQFLNTVWCVCVCVGFCSVKLTFSDKYHGMFILSLKPWQHSTNGVQGLSEVPAF